MAYRQGRREASNGVDLNIFHEVSLQAGNAKQDRTVSDVHNEMRCRRSVSLRI